MISILSVSEILSLAALTLTILALFMAFRQQRSARLMVKSLGAVEGSLSTRYLGEFPDYLTHIPRLLSEAKTRVLIACSVPTYGIFSDPRSWIRYRSSIEILLNDRIPIDLVCLTEAGRRVLQIEQFGWKRKNWKEWKRLPAFEGQLKDFLERVAPATQCEGISRDQFLQLLEDQQEMVLKESFQRVDVTQIDGPLGLHVWVIDGSKAIFSMLAFSDEATEYGFITSDSRLVKSLEAMQSRLKRKAGGAESDEGS